MMAKVSAISLTSKKRQGKKITMVTAYDYPSAVHVARAGIDIILIGDSVAMVELGYENTQPMTMEQMLHHCSTVKRGVDYCCTGANSTNVVKHIGTPLLVGDMPFGTYEFENTDIALQNAYRFVKEAGMDAVKLEVRLLSLQSRRNFWSLVLLTHFCCLAIDDTSFRVYSKKGGSPSRARTARKIVDGGVAVMGHVGLTPQAISVIGGFRAQGRTAIRARALLDEAMRLQDAGAFAVVLECVPTNVAAAITESLEIPTIGIGAGGETSGQVLVFHDMLGMLSHPHHEQFVPKFCKRYAQVGHIIQDGLKEFKKDVESGAFPGHDFAPYVMAVDEKEAFDLLLAKDAEERQRKHDAAAEKYVQTDEYEKLHLYGTDKDSK
jgi:3-methyl-2-oxobutanoate hydroxymethyltransferase